MPKILIADDDAFILDYVSRILKKENFELIIAKDGKEAFEAFQKSTPDLVLLDVMMPYLDGLEVCSKIREIDPVIPIILLTAKQQTDDKIEGLQLGADDYVTKPFERKELLARIERNLQRGKILSQAKNNASSVENESQPEILKVDSLEININSWKVFYKDTQLKTSKTEFELLKLFCLNKDQLLARETLLKEVWGYDYVGNSRTVDNFIMRLRKNLQKVAGEEEGVFPILETVYGMGYRLRSSEGKE